MGRKFGNKNKATLRAENAARQAAYRERQREKAEMEAEDAEQHEAFTKERIAAGLAFFGETEAGINAINISEEIEAARRFAKLLQVRDIEQNENKRGYILLVLKAWVDAECPLLDTTIETFSDRKGSVPVEKYTFPEGADAPFTKAA